MTVNELLALAEQIRIETVENNNDSERVGAALKSIINYFQTVVSSIYDVSTQIPLETGYYTPTTARAAVPVAVRKKGLVISFNTSATAYSIQEFYQGEVTAWATEGNWRDNTSKVLAALAQVQTNLTEKTTDLQNQITGVAAGYIDAIAYNAAAPTPAKSGYYEFSTGGSCAWITGGAVTVKVGDRVAVKYTAPSTYVYTHIPVDMTNTDLYNVTVKVPLAAGSYYTAATARAAVPTNIKKLGLKITYATASGVWVEEQYVGGDLSGWGSDGNWENILKNEEFKPVKIKTNYLVIGNDGSFYVTDELGNIGLKLDNNGKLIVNEISTNNANFSISTIYQLISEIIKIGNTTILSNDKMPFCITDELGNIGLKLDNHGKLIVSEISPNIANFSIATIYKLISEIIKIGNTTILLNDKLPFCITDELGNIAFSVDFSGKTNFWTGSVTNIFGKLADINHFMNYGQSLSVDWNGGSVESNYSDHIYTFNKGPIMRSYDNDSTKYVSLKIDNSGTGVSCMGRLLKQLIESDGYIINDTNQIYDILVSSPGEPGYTIQQLSKGTLPYNRLIDGVRNGKSLANSIGKTYNFPILFWMQGESNINDSPSLYRKLLVQLQKDISKDVKEITGQKNEVLFLNYQFSSENKYASTADIPLELNLIGLEENYFYPCQPTYPYTHSDDIHLTAQGYAIINAVAANAMKKIVIDNIDWKHINIKNIVFQGKILEITLHVPIPPLVIDDTTVIDPGNYGFNIYSKDGVEILINSVSISRPDTIRIITSSNLENGMILTYAINGTAGKSGPIQGSRGCIRDSQGDSLKYKSSGLNYRLDNWLPKIKITINN